MKRRKRIAVPRGNAPQQDRRLDPSGEPHYEVREQSEVERLARLIVVNVIRVIYRDVQDRSVSRLRGIADDVLAGNGLRTLEAMVRAIVEDIRTVRLGKGK